MAQRQQWGSSSKQKQAAAAQVGASAAEEERGQEAHRSECGSQRCGSGGTSCCACQLPTPPGCRFWARADGGQWGKRESSQDAWLWLTQAAPVSNTATGNERRAAAPAAPTAAAQPAAAHCSLTPACPATPARAAAAPAPPAAARPLLPGPLLAAPGRLLRCPASPGEPQTRRGLQPAQGGRTRQDKAGQGRTRQIRQRGEGRGME